MDVPSGLTPGSLALVTHLPSLLRVQKSLFIFINNATKNLLSILPSLMHLHWVPPTRQLMAFCQIIIRTIIQSIMLIGGLPQVQLLPMNVWGVRSILIYHGGYILQRRV